MATDGSITITETTFSSMKCVVFAWTSGSDGGVSGIFTVGAYDGAVVEVATTPGAGGVQPTAYTFQVLDGNGLDILTGGGTARSTTVTEYIKAPLGACASSKLQLVVASAGNGKSGTVYVFLR